MTVDSIDWDYLFIQYALHAQSYISCFQASRWPMKATHVLYYISQKCTQTAYGERETQWLGTDGGGENDFVCSSVHTHTLTHTRTRARVRAHTLIRPEGLSALWKDCHGLTFGGTDDALLTESLRILHLAQYAVPCYVSNFNSRPKIVSSWPYGLQSFWYYLMGAGGKDLKRHSKKPF